MHQFFQYSPIRHHFEYGWYNLELLRLLGASAYEGCDAAEFLETVGRLQPNDPESWQRNWLGAAERTRDLAESMQQSGHRALARGAYLRASNYFRCAQYLFPIVPGVDGPFNLYLYHRSILYFKRAASLMEHEVHAVEIPRETAQGLPIQMPGWLYLPAAADRLQHRKTPVLICFGGADSTKEELYFMSVADGPRLGYAVLTFDGPGQGLVLREQNIPLQPEGEALISCVIEFLCTFDAAHPDVNLDLEAITVTGQSLGAYLALRAAADPRVKVCVAIDPFYDMWDLAMARMPGLLAIPWTMGYVGDWLINWAANTHGQVDISTKYQFGLAQLMFGTADAASTLREMKKYTFKLPGSGEDYLHKIKCPVLVTGAAADPKSFLPELSTGAIMKNLINVPKSQKELWVASEYSGGGAQAKSGAWPLAQHRTYKFLDARLGIDRSREF